VYDWSGHMTQTMALTTPIHSQNLILTDTNMISQPNLEVNKQPDMEELKEKTQGLKQDKQNSRDKQTRSEIGNRKNIEITEENNITEISNKEMHIDEEVN
ncbi:37467_t:CDS:2, partial [Gigaspora margarita]